MEKAARRAMAVAVALVMMKMATVLVDTHCTMNLCYYCIVFMFY